MAKRKLKSVTENIVHPMDETVFIDASEPVAEIDSTENVISKNNSQFYTLDNRLLIVKVDTTGLSSEDSNLEIKKVETTLGDLFINNNVNCLLYVTHNKVVVELV